MPGLPEATQCAICQRVDAKIRQLPELQGKLSSSEIDKLITDVQAAVLNKEVNKSRGTTMSEKVVIEKAVLDEILEANNYTLLLIEKMAQDLARTNNTVVILGGELADHREAINSFAKGAFGADGLDVEEAPAGDDAMGEEANEVTLPGEGAAPAGPAAPMAPAAPAGPAPMMGGPCGAAPAAAPAAPPMPTAAAPAPMGPDAMMTKGVATSFEYPAFKGERVMTAHEFNAKVENMEKSNSMDKIGTKTQADLVAELKAQGFM